MAYRPVQSHEEYLEILEQYKDYQKGAYRSMSLEEKIDFLTGYTQTMFRCLTKTEMIHCGHYGIMGN